MDDYENPSPGKTYISPSLKPFVFEGKEGDRVRIASKTIESEDAYAFADIKSERVIRLTKSGATNITAKFFETDRRIFVLSIQGYTSATDKPHNASFSFVGEEITTLYDFLQSIQSIVCKSRGSMNMRDEDLKSIVLSQQQALKLVEENQELFAEVIAASITKNDVVSVGYRKKQLEIFRRLLDEPAFFAEAKAKKDIKTNEGLWQAFFEKTLGFSATASATSSSTVSTTRSSSRWS